MSLGRIIGTYQVAVTSLQGKVDTLANLTGLSLPCAVSAEPVMVPCQLGGSCKLVAFQAHLRDFGASVQSVGLSERHCDSFQGC